MKRRLLSALLALCMVLTMAPTVAFAAEGDVTSGAQQTNGPVYDLSDDTAARTVSTDCTLTCSTEFPVTIDGSTNGITVTLQDAEIRVSDNSGIKILGNVTLNLVGENTVEGGNTSRLGFAGIEVEEDASLTVTGDGKLTALAGAGMQKVTGSSNDTQYDRGGDGIGGNGRQTGGPAPSGTFALESGTVAANGIAGGSGIGCREIIVNGGDLEANADRKDLTEYEKRQTGGYGLGSSDTESIVIADGIVTAVGDSAYPGIGADEVMIRGGEVGASGGGGVISPDITIEGDANVTAESSMNYPGIGDRNDSVPVAITIQGNASVEAAGGTWCAGIGGGSVFSSGTQPITIKILGNASATAVGGPAAPFYYEAGAGIGSGFESQSGSGKHSIEIDTTGTVSATGGENTLEDGGAGAGIGGGGENSIGTIIIRNGTITAIGGKGDSEGAGAGIGGGYYGASGNITISGGIVNATSGGYCAAGIGSGRSADVDQITISGGEVTATGGDYSAAIGAGFAGGAGTIKISGGTIRAKAVFYGAAIGIGQSGGTGTIDITGGTIYAVGAPNTNLSPAIGGYDKVDVPVTISDQAEIYAFSYEKAAIPEITDASAAPLVQGVFGQSTEPIPADTTLSLGNAEITTPSTAYRGFAFTVPAPGDNYVLSYSESGTTYAATHGNGEEASNQLSTSEVYNNLYWSATDEAGNPIDTIEPDPVEPDDSWMDAYEGKAEYDAETGVTTITGSITDGKYLYVIPEGTKGKVILDGTGYIDALISQCVNRTGELWNPGSTSGDLPIVIQNNSDLRYSYADASFGLDEAAEAQERYHIASTFGGQRLGQDNDKVILRTASQPIQALYGMTSSSSLTTANLIDVEDKVEELGFDSFAAYALNYYKTNFEDAKDATSLLDLPVQYQLNLMGYASPAFDYPDLVQGNMGTNMSAEAAEEFLKTLTEDERANVIAVDGTGLLEGTTNLYLLETDPAIIEMGRQVAYKYGIAFTFNSGVYSVVSGESGATEENLKYLNEGLGWTALSNAELSAEALQENGLTKAQEAIANTAGKISLMPGGTDESSMPRGQLVMPGYAIPNAMCSTAMLRGLTMQIELDASVTIKPADITIYTGGTGYDSVVTDDKGNDVDTSATNGLPTPGFYINLPDDVNKWLLENVPEEAKIENAAGETIVDLSDYLTFTYHDDNGIDRIWKLARYDKKPNTNNSMAYNQFIYRIEPAKVGDEEIPIRLQFTDDEGAFMTSDDFTVNLNDLFHTYYMSIYAGDLNQQLVKAVLTVNNQPAEYSAVVQSGELTVRGVTDNGTHTTDVVTTAPTAEVSSVTAQVADTTTFHINGSQLEVENGSQVKLLVDSMVPDSNNTLVNRAVNQFDTIPDDYNCETRYLDLVDTSNGNVYVTASDTVTLYWAYPEGTDENTEFHLVHYEGLDRNDNTDLAEGDYKMTLFSEDNNNLEMTPQGIKFKVTSFSPFALFWEDDNDGGNTGGGGGSTDEPDKPDDLNTEDHFAYIIGYPKDYRTGEPTDDESLWPVEPQGDITRAEVATIFFRMLTDDARSENWSQTNSFTDVASTEWYNNAISTLANMGIISGDPDGSFRPDDSITRAEFTKIAVGFFDKAGDYVDGTYEDVSASDWYADFIDAAVDLGLIEGYPDGTIRPNASITRAEACTIVNRTLGRVPDKDHLLAEDEMRVWPDNSDTDAWYYAQIQEATNSHDYNWITEDGEEIEEWTDKLADRDWAQLEREWSDANSAPGGEVVD